MIDRPYPAAPMPNAAAICPEVADLPASAASVAPTATFTVPATAPLVDTTDSGDRCSIRAVTQLSEPQHADAAATSSAPTLIEPAR